MKRFLRVPGFWVSVWLGVAQAGAQIVAEPGAVDLGRRGQQQLIESRVVLVNSGKEAVTISDIEGDCSCTMGTVEKLALAAGEKTELLIRTETRNYQGEIFRRIVLRTSAGELVVPVKVLVTPYERWNVTPPFLTLGPSGRGKTVAGEVILTHLGTEPAGQVDIVGIKGEPDWVTGMVTRREGKDFVVELAKKAEAPAGHHVVKLTATTTDPVNPEVEFSVFMSVTSAVKVKPSPLVMPVVPVGKETRLKAELLGWSDEALPRLELAHGRVTIAGAGTEGIAFEIAITPEKAGAMTQLLRIYRGEELELEVAVILRAE